MDSNSPKQAASGPLVQCLTNITYASGAITMPKPSRRRSKTLVRFGESPPVGRKRPRDRFPTSRTRRSPVRRPVAASRLKPGASAYGQCERSWSPEHPCHASSHRSWAILSCIQAPPNTEMAPYSLDVPYQDTSWYVVVEELGHVLTQVGPIAIALRDQKKLDIACVEGGEVRGKVKAVPPTWVGNVWVVAFSKTAVRAGKHVSARTEHSRCQPCRPVTMASRSGTKLMMTQKCIQDCCFANIRSRSRRMPIPGGVRR